MKFKKRKYKCCVCMRILKNEPNYLLIKVNDIKVNPKTDEANYNTEGAEEIEWFCSRCFELYVNIIKCYEISTRKYWENRNRWKGIKNEDRVNNKVNQEISNEN